GQVHRVVQGQVPDGEGLELGVACLDAPLVLMVELAQAGGQLAAAGAGGGDHHQLPGGLDVVVLAVALVADDVGDVGGVAGDVKVVVHPDAQPLQPGLEGLHHRQILIHGQHHAAHVQPQLPEHLNQANHVPVVGDAQVPPDL